MNDDKELAVTEEIIEIFHQEITPEMLKICRQSSFLRVLNGARDLLMKAEFSDDIEGEDALYVAENIKVIRPTVEALRTLAIRISKVPR